MPLFGEADAWAAEHSLACFTHGYLMFGFEFVLNVMGTNDVLDVNGCLSFFLVNLRLNSTFLAIAFGLAQLSTAANWAGIGSAKCPLWL
jgi:hypothetical protein